jgi:hypothetical protein
MKVRLQASDLFMPFNLFVTGAMLYLKKLTPKVLGFSAEKM